MPSLDKYKDMRSSESELPLECLTALLVAWLSHAFPIPPSPFILIPGRWNLCHTHAIVAVRAIGRASAQFQEETSLLVGARTNQASR